MKKPPRKKGIKHAHDVIAREGKFVHWDSGGKLLCGQKDGYVVDMDMFDTITCPACELLFKGLVH